MVSHLRKQLNQAEVAKNKSDEELARAKEQQVSAHFKYSNETN